MEFLDVALDVLLERASAKLDFLGVGVWVFFCELLVDREGVPESTLPEGLPRLATGLVREGFSCTELQSQSTAHRIHLLLVDAYAPEPGYNVTFDENKIRFCSLREHTPAGFAS